MRLVKTFLTLADVANHAGTDSETVLQSIEHGVLEPWVKLYDIKLRPADGSRVTVAAGKYFKVGAFADLRLMESSGDEYVDLAGADLVGVDGTSYTIDAEAAPHPTARLFVHRRDAFRATKASSKPEVMQKAYTRLAGMLVLYLVQETKKPKYGTPKSPTISALVGDLLKFQQSFQLSETSKPDFKGLRKSSLSKKLKDACNLVLRVDP